MTQEELNILHKRGHEKVSGQRTVINCHEDEIKRLEAKLELTQKWLENQQGAVSALKSENIMLKHRVEKLREGLEFNMQGWAVMSLEPHTPDMEYPPRTARSVAAGYRQKCLEQINADDKAAKEMEVGDE